MPQFQPQRLKPLSPRALRGALRRIRQLADLIEAHADATEPREKATATRAINGLACASRVLMQRRMGVS